MVAERRTVLTVLAIRNADLPLPTPLRPIFSLPEPADDDDDDDSERIKVGKQSRLLAWLDDRDWGLHAGSMRLPGQRTSFLDLTVD